MFPRVRDSFRLCVSLSVLLLLNGVLSAQGPSAKSAKSPAKPPASTWDFFVGYSFLQPWAKIHAVPWYWPGSTYGDILAGSDVSISHYFNQHFGLQVEGNTHVQSEDFPPTSNRGSLVNSNDNFAGVSAGPVWRAGRPSLDYFAHALVGVENVGHVYHPTQFRGPLVTLGGGLDIGTPLLKHHLAFRLVQADFQYTHADSTSIPMVQISTGVVYRILPSPQPPVALKCSLSETTLFQGTPVSFTQTAENLNPKLNAVYSWSVAGASGKGSTATLDTTQLAAGAYTVKGIVKEGKPGREGMKPGESAECLASFTVREYEPPTVSCQASPSSLHPGETASVQATAKSPQNRTLRYFYTATAGSVQGSEVGTTAVYNSAGAAVGTVGITCTVKDDKDHTASDSTTLQIKEIVVIPPPSVQALCSLSFANDTKRPTRVDNEAKACLDDVALRLKKEPKARLLLVGQSTAAEKAAYQKAAQIAAKKKAKATADPAAQRAVNAKSWLVKDKGIDSADVLVATRSAEGSQVATYLVPNGASIEKDVPGTLSVNESQVPAEERKALSGKGSVKKTK